MSRLNPDWEPHGPTFCLPSPVPFAAAVRHIAAVLELLCDNLHTTQINTQ